MVQIQATIDAVDKAIKDEEWLMPRSGDARIGIEMAPSPGRDDAVNDRVERQTSSIAVSNVIQLVVSL
jgi:hypothetical protein